MQVGKTGLEHLFSAVEGREPQHEAGVLTEPRHIFLPVLHRRPFCRHLKSTYQPDTPR